MSLNAHIRPAWQNTGGAASWRASCRDFFLRPSKERKAEAVLQESGFARARNSNHEKAYLHDASKSGPWVGKWRACCPIPRKTAQSGACPWPGNAARKRDQQRADRLRSRLLCLLFMGIREKWRAGLLCAGWLSFLASRSHSGLHEEQDAGNEWTGCKHCVFCSAIHSMMS